MAQFIIADRVQETTATTGTGPFTLVGAVQDQRAFGDVMSVGDWTWGCIFHPGSGEWVSGKLTYSDDNELTVTEVDESSNGDMAVSFSAGTKIVVMDLPASRLGTTESIRDGAVTEPKMADDSVSPRTITDDLWSLIFPPGTPRLTMLSVARSRFVMMNDGTIGDASSGASTRANA